MHKPQFRLAQYLQHIALVPAFSNPALLDTVDVAIIGGGLSGLTAAKNLLDGGKSILVFEAKDRIGGKIFSKQLKDGGEVEVGAEFVGKTQDRVLHMISELGLELFETYNEGASVLWRNNTRLPYVPNELTGSTPPTDPVTLEQVAIAQGQIDTWASEIDRKAPWSHPKAEEWDGITFAEWLEQWASLPDAKFIFETFSRAVWAAEPKEMSLFYVLAYIAAAGNETSIGETNKLIAVENGGEEWRVKGGTHRITQALADLIGDERILINSPVQCVTQRTDGLYKVEANSAAVVAKKVVVAMPPPLVNEITFSPELPHVRQQLNQNMRLASIGKGIAAYKEPFWRTSEDLNGQVISDHGAVKLTFDTSPEDASTGSIMGFILGDDMRSLDSKPEGEVQEEIVSDYVRYFGDEGGKVTDFVLQRWDMEMYIKGGPVAHSPPNVLQKFGPALREPVDGIHWAGTETSEYWFGFMDGAIRAGERVAQEILHASPQVELK